MLKFFKTINNVPKIEDSQQIDNMYRFWRVHILIMMYIGYATFYFTRKSFNFVMPQMMAETGITKTEIGILTTLFYIIYGVSKFLSGAISDASNPRYFMAFGFLLTGVINILFGFASSYIWFLILWSLNAFFQGWGWPPCGKLLTHWYSRSERGTWWSIWNTSHNLGGAIIPIIVGFLAIEYGWRTAFMIVGVWAILNSLLLFWRLRDKPESMGLPSVDDWKNNENQKEEKLQKTESWFTTIRYYVLNNKFIWLLGFASILVYIVRTAINDWGNLYLTETYKYDLIKANTCVSFFEIGGFIGALIAGFASDYFSKGNRGPMNFIYSIGICFSCLLLYFNLSNNYFYQAACYFLIGFFVFGPQMLLGIAAVECSHRKVAGAATGFIGLFSYIGAAISGYPVAKILEVFHWNGFFTTIIIAALISSLILAIFIPNRTRIKA